MSNILRVLEVVSSLRLDSGVSSFIFNNNSFLEEYQFQFDYVCHDIKSRKIKKSQLKGSPIYHLPELSLPNILHLSKIIKEEFFLKKTYDIVHCNVPNAGFLYMPLAKLAGIRTRIVHSHADSRTSDSFIKDMRNRILIKIGNSFSNHFMACSNSAGQFLFGENCFDVVYNGIDGSKFIFDKEIREKIRKAMGFSNRHVVACVGRLCKQKNQKFLLDLLPHLVEELPDVLVVFVGTGEDESSLKNQVKSMQLENNVRFLGLRQDVNQLYCAFDLLAMPSFYEGFPYVAIEAQNSNLPILFSENITHECDLNGLNHRVALTDKNLWLTLMSDILKRSVIETRMQPLPERIRRMNIKYTSAQFFRTMRRYVDLDTAMINHN